MTGKNERLRAGEVVELKPGLKGRLNFQEKKLELSNGLKLSLSKEDQRELFPENEEAKKDVQLKEKTYESIENIPGGEFLFQLGQHGAPKALKDWGNKFLKSKEEQQRINRVQGGISQEISEESPITSGAAYLTSLIPDIALTKGMRAVTAAPTLTAIHAGPRILEEPGQVLGEAAIASAGGAFIDKAMKGVQNVAARRAEHKALPGQRQAIAEANLAGKEATTLENLEARKQNNILSERINNENSARMHQYNLEIAEREKIMKEAENAFMQKKTSNKADYDAYKLAKKEYDETLAKLPELQKQAQETYSKSVVENAKNLEKNFPKNSKIHVNSLDVDSFVDQSINKTGITGTPDAKRATQIIKSLFPEGEAISSKQLAQRYESLEGAIQRSTPEVQRVLSEFKTHMGQRLPLVLEDSILFSKIMPRFSSTVEKDIVSVLSKMKGIEKGTISKIESNAHEVLKNIESGNFANRFETGEISREIIEKIAPLENFVSGLSAQDVKSIMSAPAGSKWAHAYKNIINGAKVDQKAFSDALAQKMFINQARFEIEMGSKAAKDLSKQVKNTFGTAERIKASKAPIEPILNEPIATESPGMPIKPIQMSNPSAPIPNTFLPQPEPTLRQGTGISDTVGDFLENETARKNNLLSNPMGKLTNLRYLSKIATLPYDIAKAGLKGLTSPTQAGEIARLSFKQAGLQAIVSLAQRYPSYHDGILEDPREQRSLTKQIENDPEIPLEQKAIFQSKVNRQIPLERPLR